MTFEEIAEFLSQNGWRVVFRKIDDKDKTDGITEYHKNRISIDSKICREVADTMIHEYLHAKHSDNWSERKVRRETKKIIGKMSEKEIVRMAKQIFRTVPLGE